MARGRRTGAPPSEGSGKWRYREPGRARNVPSIGFHERDAKRDCVFGSRLPARVERAGSVSIGRKSAHQRPRMPAKRALQPMNSSSEHGGPAGAVESGDPAGDATGTARSSSASGPGTARGSTAKVCALLMADLYGALYMRHQRRLTPAGLSGRRCPPCCRALLTTGVGQDASPSVDRTVMPSPGGRFGKRSDTR